MQYFFGRTGETALIMALEACDQELAIFLMGAGSDLFRRNCFGETAMHIAAKKVRVLHSSKMLSLTIVIGVSPESASRSGTHALWTRCLSYPQS